MHEQGKAAAWCGRLLLFTAMTVGGAGVAALSVWAFALPVLLGGAPAGRRATARPTAPRTGPPRGPWPISGAPRPPLLARLSVPRA
ncbi:hypothetical protein ACGFSD_36070 [Streptomyces caniferus]|uniref:hypothetical protein n=1 Tax=Streptomyces caniferus TaxID=285557 RepID=UPI00371E8E2D